MTKLINKGIKIPKKEPTTTCNKLCFFNFNLDHATKGKKINITSRIS